MHFVVIKQTNDDLQHFAVVVWRLFIVLDTTAWDSGCNALCGDNGKQQRSKLYLGYKDAKSPIS